MSGKTKIIPLTLESEYNSEDIPLSARSMTSSEYDRKIICENNCIKILLFIAVIGFGILISML